MMEKRYWLVIEQLVKSAERIPEENLVKLIIKCNEVSGNEDN